MKNKFVLFIFFSITSIPLHGGFLDWVWNNKLTTFFGATTVGFGVTTYLYSQKLNETKKDLTTTAEQLTTTAEQLTTTAEQLTTTKNILEKTSSELGAAKKNLELRNKTLTEEQNKVIEANRELESLRSKLENSERNLFDKEQSLTKANANLKKITQERDDLKAPRNAQPEVHDKNTQTDSSEQNIHNQSPSTPPSTPKLSRSNSIERMNLKHQIHTILTTILTPFLKPGEKIESQNKQMLGNQASQEIEFFIINDNGKKILVSHALSILTTQNDALLNYFLKKNKYTTTRDSNTGALVIANHSFGNQPLSPTQLANEHSKELD